MAKRRNNVINIEKHRRPSKREQDIIASNNKDIELAAGIVWPEIGEPADWPEDESEDALGKLGQIDFPGVPEWLGDGWGSGTPEFRERLEAYFRQIGVAGRFAIMVLAPSRSKLVEMTLDEDLTKHTVHVLRHGHGELMCLARYVRAAEVRVVVASVLREMRDAGEEPPKVAS